ncbi:hypothetical protein T484DRAFT_1836522, partial [Baffinella frigidus]
MASETPGTSIFVLGPDSSKDGQHWAEDEDEDGEWNDELIATQPTARTLAVAEIVPPPPSDPVKRKRRAPGGESPPASRRREQSSANSDETGQLGGGPANDAAVALEMGSGRKAGEVLQHKGWTLGGALAPFEDESQDIFSDRGFQSALASSFEEQAGGAGKEAACSQGAPQTFDLFASSPQQLKTSKKALAGAASSPPQTFDLFSDPSSPKVSRNGATGSSAAAAGGSARAGRGEQRGASQALKQEAATRRPTTRETSAAAPVSAGLSAAPRGGRRGGARGGKKRGVTKLSDMLDDVAAFDTLDGAGEGGDASAGKRQRLSQGGSLCAAFEGEMCSIDEGWRAPSPEPPEPPDAADAGAAPLAPPPAALPPPPQSDA